MKKKFVLLVASASVGALLVAGCSSSTKSDGGKSGSPDGSSSSSVSKDPIVIGADTSDTGTGPLKSTADALEAWAKFVNAKGGVAGRQIKINRCDDAGTPEKNAACARNLVNDKSVVAVAGSATRAMGSAQPIFEAAGMPYVCASPSSLGEFSMKTGFCIRGGAAVGFAGILDYWKKQGLTRIALFGSDSAAGHQSNEQAKLLIKAAGLTHVGDNLVSQTAADYLPAAQATINQKPDAILLGFAPAVNLQVIQALSTAGSTASLGINSGSMSPAIQASPLAAGAITETTFPPIDSNEPGMSDFLAGMKAAGYESEIDGGYTLGGWLSGAILGKIIEDQQGNVTRESILKVLQNDTVSGVPLLPSMSRSQAPTSLPDLGAVANPSTHVAKIVNGKLEVVGTYTLK